MENCQCNGSPSRPPCSAIDAYRLAFNTHEDLSGLVFTRSSASKLLSLDSKSVDSGLLDRFTLFPNLPAELRLEIWKLALSSPRLIVVSYTSATGEGDKRLFVDTPPPAACILVCRESRAEALKIYSKHLLTTQCHSPTNINFASDLFLIGGPDSDIDMDYLLSILLPENAHKVKYLHVSRGCWKQFGYWTDLRERFSGLRELTISFPTGAALLPYTHECWYGALAPENKNTVVRSELYTYYDDDENEFEWKPGFELRIIQYDSPPLKGEY
jgi:2EXR family